jgi:hypothetical protein
VFVNIGLLIPATLSAIGGLGGASAGLSMRKIERQRQHTSLEPEFDVDLRTRTEDLWQLSLLLEGPAGLDRLDELIVTVRNDRPDRAPATAGEPTQEQIDQQVWGPLQFREGIENQHGPRTASWRNLERGERAVFLMQYTSPPPWSTGSPVDWRVDHGYDKARLTLTCRRKGYQPWTIPREEWVVPHYQRGSG